MTTYYEWNGTAQPEEGAPPVRKPPPFTTPHVVDVSGLKIGDFYEVHGTFHPIRDMAAPTRSTKILHFSGEYPQVVHGTVTVYRSIQRIGPARQALAARPT